MRTKARVTEIQKSDESTEGVIQPLLQQILPESCAGTLTGTHASILYPIAMCTESRMKERK